MNPQPLDYASSRGSARRLRKADVVVFFCGALSAGLFFATYFIFLGHAIIFERHPALVDIAFSPGYVIGNFVYYDMNGSYNISVAVGIAAFVLFYGVAAVILRRGFLLLRRSLRR